VANNIMWEYSEEFSSQTSKTYVWLLLASS